MKIIIQYLSFIILTFCAGKAISQETDANIFGDVQSNGKHIPFANIFIEGTTIGTTTDYSGHYMLINLPAGKHSIVAQAMGYKKQTIEIEIVADKTIEVNFQLEEEIMSMDEVVVTGTKTFKRSTESPVIVNVLDGHMLNMLQANTLSEGLSFQPGLRMETDCQTCNYTQLRMNGLGGSYSQILINSRPVFSPLTGLYGLEQIPSNMINRIEVVRGGGSALYGSSAIGGTVNVITKIPQRNAFSVNTMHSSINGRANDNSINANVNALSQKRNAGVTFFGSRREREWYDHEGENTKRDNYSELPKLKNNSFGLLMFLKPTHNQKLELNFSSMYEFRYGGEMVDKPSYQAEQSEERTHNIFMGGLDYEINFNDYNSSFILYAAGQSTKRNHYTGIIPDSSDSDAYTEHFLNPPYGNTTNSTYQAGTQINHTIQDFFGGKNTITAGLEYKYDDIYDRIPAYETDSMPFVDQTTRNIGALLQSDWTMFKGFTLLAGLRADKHNMVPNTIFSPRVSVLYKIKNTQLRASWSTGFRAPQAFDSDLHIAFAAGEITRIKLAPNLKEEKSNSYNASLNFDLPAEGYIYGFTLEGFYTKLENAFILEESGSDNFGVIYEKRNGSESVVEGVTLEARFNYNRKVQLEAGYTLQSSKFKDEVSYSENLEPTKDYLRSPNQYGYYTLTFTPDNSFNASLSGVYTGSMKIVHLAGAPELPENDIYVNTESFLETNIKVSYLFKLKKMDSGLELFAGIKNLFNNYQNDFDTGKNRDSNYIYGPSLPRTYYIGLKIKSL